MHPLGTAFLVGVLIVALGALGTSRQVEAQSPECSATLIPQFNAIRLSWTATYDVDHYEIYRNDSAAAMGSTIFDYWTDTSPVPGVPYEYAIAAIGATGVVEWLCYAQATLPTAATVPEFPYGFAFLLALFVPVLLVLRKMTLSSHAVS